MRNSIPLKGDPVDDVIRSLKATRAQLEDSIRRCIRDERWKAAQELQESRGAFHNAAYQIEKARGLK